MKLFKKYSALLGALAFFGMSSCGTWSVKPNAEPTSNATVAGEVDPVTGAGGLELCYGPVCVVAGK